MKRINADTFTGIAFALLSVALLWATAKIPDDQAYGPTAFPSIVAKAMLVIGVALAVQSLFKNNIPKFQFSREGVIRVATLAVLSVIYVALLPVIGFLPSTLLLFAPTLWIFGMRQKILFATVAIIMPTAIYVIFQFILRVPLP